MSARRIPAPALLLLALAASCSRGAPEGARNLVLISIDTCRADHLGCYGFPQDTTPHLDALAAAGTLFEQASSTGPITLPSHSSLLTGTLPLRHGVLDNMHRLDEGSETLAEVLAARGYRTAAFVSAFVLDARFGIGQGFQVYDDDLGEAASEGEVREELINERRAEETNRAALEWLEGNHRERFFLFLHYFDPHARYDPPAPFDERFAGDPYAGEIAYVDRCIGEVVARLEALGRMDDTVLVVTSDHGESLGEHGEPSHSYFVYQSTLRVPLIVRAPGALAGRRVAEPVSLVDVAPTALALLGEPPSPRHAGRDLGGLLFHEGAKLGEAPIYSESLYPTKYRAAALRSLRLGRWKYIWNVAPELYDLDADPGELNDLAAGEAERASALRAELLGLLAASAGAAGDAGGAVALDAEARERIRALGYADAGVRAGFDIDPEAADAKDRLALHNGLMQVHQASANGELEAATELATELASEHPWLLEAHALLGGLAERQERTAAAVRHYEEYLLRAEQERALDPEAAAARLNPGVVAVLVALAGVEEQRKTYDRAALCYQGALVLDAGHVDALLGYAQLLAQGRRRFGQAAELYERALAAGEDTQHVHANLGNCLFALGRHEEAAGHYRRALELGPDPALAQNLGAVLGELGRWREAREVLEPLSAQTSDARALVGLATAQLELGELPAAEENFRRAKGLAPGAAEAALGLARCRLAAGEEADARAEVARLLANAPGAAGAVRAAVFELAAHPSSERRRPAAALLFAEVLEGTGGGAVPEVLDALGVALAASGRFDEAAAAAERALSGLGAEDAQTAAPLRARLELYRAGRPFVRPGAP